MKWATSSANRAKFTHTRRWVDWLTLAGVSLVVYSSHALMGDARVTIGVALLAYLVLAALGRRTRAATRWLPLLVAATLCGLAALHLMSGTGAGLTWVDALLAAVVCWLIRILADRESNADRDAGAPQTAAIHEILGIKPAAHFESALQLEMLRSRRYERPFSHLTLQFSTPLTSFAEADKKLLRKILAESVRHIDQIHVANRPNEIFLICPENEPDGAALFSGRLRRQLQQLNGCDVAIGWAAFPLEALTIQNLRIEARKKLTAGERGASEKEHSVTSAVARQR